MGPALLNLEKRLLAVEMFLGIIPDASRLTHPKAYRQALKERRAAAAYDLLRDELHRYIYSHYDQGTQASFTAMAAAILAILLSPESTETDKAQTQIQLMQLVAEVLPAWTWVQQVLKHYYAVSDQIAANGGIYIEPDFGQFNASDPGASLRRLVKGE